MRDYLSLGPTPSDEDCQQVGTPTYDHAAARAECRRYIEQLRRTFGDEPGTARLAIRSNPHDFGTYLDVVCYFDDNDDAAIEYAYRVENDAPSRWDDDGTSGQDRQTYSDTQDRRTYATD